MMKRLAVASLFTLLALPALAQPASINPATNPAPATSSPAVPTAVAPARKPAALATPAVGIVNVNTATAKELDSLPGIGTARSKAILAERAKGGFKDWSDFDKRLTGRTLNAGVKAKIKDHVSF